MRIGQGYDVHRLAENRRLIIGGVDIPFERGLLGHSDADVLAHAVMDALLGAAGLGDIGAVFPDTSPEFKDVSSMLLLNRTAGFLREKGFGIVNIDSTVVAQAPRLRPFIEDMRRNMALAAGIGPESVNVKATTEEGLGFTGAGAGIAAYSVVLIE